MYIQKNYQGTAILLLVGVVALASLASCESCQKNGGSDPISIESKQETRKTERVQVTPAMIAKAKARGLSVLEQVLTDLSKEDNSTINQLASNGVIQLTALHQAALLGDEDTIKALLSWDADPGKQASIGEIPLYFAAGSATPNSQAIKIIIQSMQDKNILTKEMVKKAYQLAEDEIFKPISEDMVAKYKEITKLLVDVYKSM